MGCVGESGRTCPNCHPERSWPIRLRISQRSRRISVWSAQSQSAKADETPMTEKANGPRLIGMVVGIVVLILALLCKRILR